MSKCKVYNFSMKQEAKVTITVNNCTNSTKVHDVKCTSDKYNWTALFSSQIVTVGASKVVIVVVCKNGSLHMFSPGDRGQSLFPPLQLPSQVCTYFTYLGLYVRFISYTKCSNWRWISKLLSNFGCLFTFCCSAWAN